MLLHLTEGHDPSELGIMSADNHTSFTGLLFALRLLGL
uniref:Uncharacterized protein n=1 Tax=Anguilla anguilla TaxID=7936 RepID=A0A0E9Q7B2_ANGAN